MCVCVCVQVDKDSDNSELGVFDMAGFDEEKKKGKVMSRLNWTSKGWSGGGWRGRHVGCPEYPDGSKSAHVI